MNNSNRYGENDKLDNFLSNFEDIFETGPIPLIIGALICVLFNIVALPFPITLKVAFIICGYVFLVFGIIKTVDNYS